MKLLRPILASLILIAQAALGTPEEETRYERTFADAAKAYDENRLPDAIAGWESLVNEGQKQPETLFNLGNAHYRSGNLGKAILAYRQAQRLAPRDPDIRANLGFAAQSAGIVLPAQPPPAGRLLDFSRTEWLMFGSVCFWLLVLALAAWILRPRFRFVSRPAALVLAGLLVVALAGLWAHHDLRQTPECVVMIGNQKVLSSPMETSTPLLAIPEGAILRKLDERGPWAQIRYDAVRGWIPSSVLSPVK